MALAEKDLKGVSNGTVSKISIDYASPHIVKFLEDKRAGSYNTFKAYRRDLNHFFKGVLDKDIEHVTMHDLEMVASGDIIAFRTGLRNEGLANSTINRRINAARSLFGFLEADFPKIRKAIFNNAKKLPENPKSYGVLTWEEGQEMIDRAKDKPEGRQLSLIIELGIKTGIRLTALLNATWDDIHHRDQDGTKIWTIEVMDKGSKHIKSISNEVKDKLKVLPQVGRLFPNLYETKVDKRMIELTEEMNLDKRRNIKFHSLKKCGINYVFDSTGDITLAQKQGNHKSAVTTMTHYMKKQEDLSKLPSYTMGEELDLSPLEDMSKEELIELIRKTKSGTQLELLRTLERK